MAKRTDRDAQGRVPRRTKKQTNLAKRTGGAPTHPVARKKTITALKKEAQRIKKSICPPPTSNLNRAQLISYINTHG